MRTVWIATASVAMPGPAACGTADSGTNADPTPASSPSASPTSVDRARGVAEAYIRAEFSGSHAGPDAGSWAPRIKPYSTSTWYAHQRRPHRGATGAGMAWTNIEKYRLHPKFTHVVTDPHDRYPRLDRERNISVSYIIGYVGAQGGRPAERAVRVATDILREQTMRRLRRTPNGRRVDDERPYHAD